MALLHVRPRSWMVCPPHVVGATVCTPLRLALSAFLTVSCLSCRATNRRGASEMSGVPVRLPEAVDSKEAWDTLEPEVRLEILDSEYPLYSTLELAPPQDARAIKDPRAKELADRMLAYAKANVDLRTDDGVHASVGGLRVEARILRLKRETILGGEIRLVQDGCSLPDQRTPHFASEADAGKAGCERTVSSAWSAIGQFNHDGTPFSVSDFMEWTGPGR